MFYKIVFLLGQFVKEICNQTVWKYHREMFVFFSMIVVGESTGFEPNFVKKNIVVCFSTTPYINISLQGSSSIWSTSSHGN
jgi:hypothetical protein